MSMRAAADEKPAAHAVFFPFPAQGHVTPALQLARLLHIHSAVRVTFVHTERNHRRILRSRGPTALVGTPGFRFATVPDGLPPPSPDDADDEHSPQHMAALVFSIVASVAHVKKLLADAAASGEPATCVVTDVEPVLLAVRQMGVPVVAFWVQTACGLMASLQCKNLIDRGLVPLKDDEQLSNGYLESTVVDWVPGMPADMRLCDLVSFIRTSNPDDAVLHAYVRAMQRLQTTPCAIILNTFDELESKVLAAMSAILPPIYAVGPFHLLAEQVVPGRPVEALGANLSREDDGCLAWLENKRPRTVVYANFGSIAALTSQQLVEFAWGLADSGHDFLMVIRDDLAKQAGPAGVLPPAFMEETKERGYITSWCPQEAVLRHDAVGAFLTHCGTNSVLESLSSGVPMLCWPFGAEQHTNCRFACTEWGVGVEINGDVKRHEVEARVTEVMGGEKGREMSRRAAEWRDKAMAAAAFPKGTSWINLERLVNDLFCPSVSE